MRIWGLIKDRCTNQKSKAYNRYGGRGIEMCEEWRNSFVAFYEDMGRRPSARHSIDRIDNNKGYSPANCRWSVPVEQQNNRRDNRLLSYAGQVETASNWARILGVRPGLLIARINAGWETERAFLTPAKAAKPKPNGATR
jgi:hypothetical protein